MSVAKSMRGLVIRTYISEGMGNMNNRKQMGKIISLAVFRPISMETDPMRNSIIEMSAKVEMFPAIPVT